MGSIGYIAFPTRALQSYPPKISISENVLFVFYWLIPLCRVSCEVKSCNSLLRKLQPTILFVWRPYLQEAGDRAHHFLLILWISLFAVGSAFPGIAGFDLAQMALP